MRTDARMFEKCLKTLKQSQLFGSCDEITLRALLDLYRCDACPKGTCLSPKTVAEQFSAVIAGRLDLTRINRHTGRQVTLYTLYPGDVFDVASLLGGKEHDIQPVAVGALEVIHAPIEKMREWMKAHPSFNGALIDYLAGKMRQLEDQTADLALHNTIRRLASLIVRHSTPSTRVEATGSALPPFVNMLTNEEMARMIGSVRAVVNRHVQVLVDQNLISSVRGGVIVRDIDKLRSFCDAAVA